MVEAAMVGGYNGGGHGKVVVEVVVTDGGWVVI